jgi:hypothetical protein
MKSTPIFSCIVVVFCLYSVFAPGEKAASAFVLRDPDMTVINPDASQQLIINSHCGVSARGVLTGYCLGARSGICRQAYDPTHCPPGRKAKTPALWQCTSYNRQHVDLSTSNCIP